MSSKNTKSAPKAAAKTSNRPQAYYLGGTADGQPPSLTPEIYDDFDVDNLHTHDVIMNEFTVGKAKITSCKSEWYYKDPKTGAQKLFYFFGPDATCFAPSFQYPLADDDKKAKPKGKGKGKTNEEGDDEDQKDPSARKGIQIGYPLTTLNTAEEPTDLEAAFMRFLDRLRARGVKIAVAETKKKGSKIHKGAKGIIMGACAPDDEEDEEEAEARRLSCVKPIYTPSRRDDSGKVKPPAWYVPLVTSGKGEELKCSTKFYDPSDDPHSARPHNPLEYTKDKGEGSSRGELGYPLFLLKESYWGPHGDTPAGMSMKCFLVQADWTEVEAGASNFVPEERSFSGGVEKYRPIGRDEKDFPSDSDESDEEVAKPKKATPKAKAKAKTTKKPVVEEAESDDESEEEEVKVKPKSKAKQTKKKEESEEEDDEDEDDEVVKVKPKSKAKAKAKKAVEEDESEDEEDE